MFKTPILLIIYKRPHLTSQVIEMIKKINPTKVYIAADGPSSSKEKKACNEARTVVQEKLSSINYKTNYSENNLGCRKRVSSAISWFFEHEKQGIILEDDCLPNISFFNFCDTLLTRYKNDERVMNISGNNFIDTDLKGNNSYYFSKIPHIWGWATWRRAWELYDVNMSSWPKFKHDSLLKNVFTEKGFTRRWTTIFDKTYNHHYNTWDFQWTYTLFSNSGLSINPRVNLVKNIGINKESTHLSDKDDQFIKKSYKIERKLKHPKFILENSDYDRLTMRNNFGAQYPWHKSILDSILR